MSNSVPVCFFSGDSFTQFRFSEEKDWEMDSFAASQVNLYSDPSPPFCVVFLSFNGFHPLCEVWILQADIASGLEMHGR